MSSSRKELGRLGSFEHPLSQRGVGVSYRITMTSMKIIHHKTSPWSGPRVVEKGSCAQRTLGRTAAFQKRFTSSTAWRRIGHCVIGALTLSLHAQWGTGQLDCIPSMS